MPLAAASAMLDYLPLAMMLSCHAAAMPDDAALMLRHADIFATMLATPLRRFTTF